MPSSEVENAFLACLPAIDTVQARINAAHDALFRQLPDGSLRPYVCSVCDEFLFCKDDIRVLTIQRMKKLHKILSWSSLPKEDRIEEVEAHYTFTEKLPNEEDDHWLQGLALSPRGCLYRKKKGPKPGFTCCPKCEQALMSRTPHVPFFGIINKNYVGCAPECLTDLNQVELAFLTPVATHGYCFTHTGGTQMQLKGTLTFMRIQERRIAEATAALENLSLTNHVVVLCHGKMTDYQRQRVSDNSKVNTRKLIEAGKWLCKYHQLWKDVDYDEIKKELESKRVIFLDHTETVDSTNATVESEELFTCYYPEGAATETSGGFDQPEAFKKFAEDMQRLNYDVELKVNIEKDFVKDNNADQLVGACLLQFPYGRGGLDETRTVKDGSLTTKVDVHEFLEHLSRLSNREFQKPMIQLISYSMISRARLLKKSRLQVRGEKTAKDLAECLNSEDLHKAIEQRREGNRYGGTRVSRKLLDSVEACTRSLPHTNEFAKTARTTSESMSHYLGMASIFLTVTFDDDNSCLMQVLSGDEVDDGRDLSQLSDQELRKWRRERRQIRIKYPGIASVHFEMLLQILVEEVVGWNMRDNCPTEDPGFFGRCIAFCLAVEEQGKNTLHGHMSAWIKGYKELQRDMFFGDKEKKLLAERTVRQYYERVASTDLFNTTNSNQEFLKQAWDHECTQESKRQRRLPQVISDKNLRILRHRKGYSELNGKFARCTHCDKSWTYEQLVCGYLAQEKCGGYTIEQEPGDTTGQTIKNDSEIPKHRLFAEVVKYQKFFGPRSHEHAPKTAINVAYQTHCSCHTDGCFRCAKGQKNGSVKMSHKCGPRCECRYRMPDRKRKFCTIKTEYKDAPWFEWNGSKKEQPIVQICAKRDTFDLFQNISCPAISESKFACNSNIQLITDGPVGMYQFKYQFKPTQVDDSKDYAQVDAIMKKMDGRVHENDKAEAVRRISRAAFAHNKTNVISPCFAAYLLRNDSRFYFSHQFVYCPLKDVIRLNSDKTVESVLKYSNDGSTYFENQALHYLCRPRELEEVSLKNYFETYEVTYVPPKSNKRKRSNDNPVMPFISDTSYYKHPSATIPKKKNVSTVEAEQGPAKQGARAREQSVCVKVSQWTFPDTSNFLGKDVTTCSEHFFNDSMELYSEAALNLLFPHRHGGDLKEGNMTFPFTRKLQAVFKDDEYRKLIGTGAIMFTNDNITFLQNIQNSARNSTRYNVEADDLQSGTEPFHPEESNSDAFEEEDDEEHNKENAYYEMFLKYLDPHDSANSDTHDNDPEYLDTKLTNFSFKPLRNKGTHQCGYPQDHEIQPVVQKESTNVFLKHRLPDSQQPTRKQKVKYPAEKKKYSRGEIVRVLFKKTRTKPRTEILENVRLQLSDANGSVSSIREWGEAVFGKDKKQRRAFEAITAAFILTFFDVHENEDLNDVDPQRTRAQFRKAKLALLRLKGERGANKNPQLIALLHGPGGSGKTTVINMVKAYAQSYCDSIGHDFTNRTILVTAMSGVAATLLHGETTHSVMGLNKRRITNEMIEQFKDARLLIIDEISFASASDFEKLHSHCIKLLQDHYGTYGGLNIVFAGDYSQLKPVGKGKRPIYDEYCAAFHGKLNCFIELDGTWRFKDDKHWGEIMLRFREGQPTLEDIRHINTTCDVANKSPPPGIQVATFKNVNRDAVNTAVFEQYCCANKPSNGAVLPSAAVIFMDNLQMKNSTETHVPVTSNAVKKHFYENCGENDLDVGDRRGRSDPVLKLYYDCPLMLVENADVPNGQANGSRVRLQSVTLKQGEEAFQLKLQCGTTVNAMYASQVLALQVKHESPDIVPQNFEVKSAKVTFKATTYFDSEKSVSGMTGNQFPLISNSCTTGHKLQGCTCLSILVNEWYYGSNWPYVVLSRVKTIAGLFIRRPLDENLKKYEMPKEMTRMLQSFRSTIALRELSDEEYGVMLKDTADFTFESASPVPRQPTTVTP